MELISWNWNPLHLDGTHNHSKSVSSLLCMGLVHIIYSGVFTQHYLTYHCSWESDSWSDKEYNLPTFDPPNSRAYAI